MESVERQKKIIKLLMEEIEAMRDTSFLLDSSPLKDKIYNSALEKIDDLHKPEDIEERLVQVTGLYTAIYALQNVAEKISDIVDSSKDKNNGELFDIFKDVSDDIKYIQSDVQIDGEEKDEPSEDTKEK